MYTQRLTLSVLPERLGICHFDKNTPIPNWALAGEGFSSIAKTNSELSVICAEGRIPGGVLAERGWRAFKVEGPLGFESTGIVSSLSTPLATAQISILYISTFESDYVLTEEKNLDKATEVLSQFCEIKQ
ncbi:MAG: ACT domain-containing protein [Candidatus Nealsonbacteria bacterium CG_4_10_14_0_2_um_filter_40_15]|uniref:ACT domain-containing protein n=1 Tax=Candidatus Nealsonbacteria bacterium CG_4_10_14_0_2_um_filter_40_15 TaxID=1974682 RepID=A0A2M7UUY9_9BACT|nr:MAG: ACT domain-containing protein [Candidatus Nealsonbacteria bacterium CG_4_10_14_0_2_um_filter_40_15]